MCPDRLQRAAARGEAWNPTDGTRGADMRGLQGKAALVTGGGSGIGKAICRRLAAEGMIVGVLDVRQEAAAGTVSEITAARGRAIPVVADITNYASVVAAVSSFEEAAGRG